MNKDLIGNSNHHTDDTVVLVDPMTMVDRTFIC